jgi:hypothetical protein
MDLISFEKYIKKVTRKSNFMFKTVEIFLQLTPHTYKLIINHKYKKIQQIFEQIIEIFE